MQIKTATSFYSDKELAMLGLKHYGRNVLISRKASFYSPEKIEVGDHVRIDDFAILSGCITIGNYVHVNAFNGLNGGKEGITLDDFCNLSSKVTIYAVSDDYSGEWMTSPLLPSEYVNIVHQPVRIGRHTIVGAGSTILPGITIGEGCAIGAMSLVKTNLAPWGIYAGVPVKYIRERKKRILELEKDFLSRISSEEAK